MSYNNSHIIKLYFTCLIMFEMLIYYLTFHKCIRACLYGPLTTTKYDLNFVKFGVAVATASGFKELLQSRD